MTDSASTPPSPWSVRKQRLSQRSAQAFHRYANWLVGISWKRFFVLSVLLIVAASILQSLPPFNWRVTEMVREPAEHLHKSKAASGAGRGMQIAIDEEGVRISAAPGPAHKPAAAAPAASAATPGGATEVPALPAAAPTPPPAPRPAGSGIEIKLPPGLSPVVAEAVREAVRDARNSIQQAIDEHVAEAAEATGHANGAVNADLPARMIQRTRRVHWGDFLTDLALLWVVGSIIIKATYKGRMQAEAKAAVATETAESEALMRQVMEARMAAMQAQVEPHFLFNTLASIDHLIQTDAARASQMQKNLIALLRASMPSLREANASGVHDLGRELAVVRPHLEILKVRMEERLATLIDVPDGLLSAEFPPLMLQSLVENSIKHGLEPKPEGGTLQFRAQIVHGSLALSVADSGLGFGKAQTAGTGVGLANIRERLALLYGSRGRLAVAENPGGGTRVTTTLPYRSLESTAT